MQRHGLAQLMQRLNEIYSAPTYQDIHQLTIWVVVLVIIMMQCPFKAMWTMIH